MQKCGNRRFVSCLWRNRDGITAVEFALLAPVFILFLLGTLEMAVVYFAQSTMESATFNASRLGKTGYSDAGKTREQMVLELVAARTDALFDTSQLTVTSKAYGTFANIDQPEPYTDSNRNSRYDRGEPYTDSNGNSQWDADMARAGLGGKDDVVVYEITYPWTFYTPLIGAFFSNNQLALSARAVVKNEPF